MVSDKELRERVEPFITKFSYDYNSNESLSEALYDEIPVATYLLYQYRNAYHDPKENETIFTQIFSACGVLDKDRNPYYQMAKKIEEEYGLDRDIIEVGGGMVPALAMEIAKRQKEIGKGTITVYDPEAIFKTLDGVKIIREKFTLATPVKPTDLLIGRKPCRATPTIIKSANKRNIEFYISLCNCDHTPDEYCLTHRGIDGNIWYDYIEETARDTLPEGMRFERVEEKSLLDDSSVTVVKTKRMR